MYTYKYLFPVGSKNKLIVFSINIWGVIFVLGTKNYLTVATVTSVNVNVSTGILSI